MKKILVTGATGTIGRQVVSQLLDTDGRVRAMTRNPDAAGLPSGVEVVRGDLTDPESLNKCLEVIDTVFLVWTAPAGAFRAALDQMARSARRVVLPTSPRPPWTCCSRPGPPPWGIPRSSPPRSKRSPAGRRGRSGTG